MIKNDVSNSYQYIYVISHIISNHSVQHVSGVKSIPFFRWLVNIILADWIRRHWTLRLHINNW